MGRREPPSPFVATASKLDFGHFGTRPDQV
jgi:hypothetical protein